MNIILYNLYYLLRHVYYHAGSPDVISIINIINDVTVIICSLNIQCFRFEFVVLWWSAVVRYLVIIHPRCVK